MLGGWQGSLVKIFLNSKKTEKVEVGDNDGEYIRLVEQCESKWDDMVAKESSEEFVEVFLAD
jgi:hypothetical protein